MSEPTVAMLRWLEARLAAIPPGGTLTVTWRRDAQGHLSRDAMVRQEQREAWPDEDLTTRVS